jgi:hypothetical protein
MKNSALKMLRSGFPQNPYVTCTILYFFIYGAFLKSSVSGNTLNTVSPKYGFLIWVLKMFMEN